MIKAYISYIHQIMIVACRCQSLKIMPDDNSATDIFPGTSFILPRNRAALVGLKMSQRWLR